LVANQIHCKNKLCVAVIDTGGTPGSEPLHPIDAMRSFLYNKFNLLQKCLNPSTLKKGCCTDKKYNSHYFSSAY